MPQKKAERKMPASHRWSTTAGASRCHRVSVWAASSLRNKVLDGGSATLLPLLDLPERGGKRRHHAIGPRAAEAFTRHRGVLRRLPQRDQDPVLRELFANALAEGASLRENKWRQRRDAQNGALILPEPLENLRSHG